MPTDLAAFYLAMAIGRVNGGRRTATGDPHSCGKAIAVIKASRRSTTAGGEFPDRVVGVTDASNRPQSPPLRGHYGRRCKKWLRHKDFFDSAPLQDNHG